MEMPKLVLHISVDDCYPNRPFELLLHYLQSSSFSNKWREYDPIVPCGRLLSQTLA
jgi:hypothetical protein